MFPSHDPTESVQDIFDVGPTPIIAALLVGLVAIVGGSLFSLFINRLLLKGVDKKRESLNKAFKVSLDRFWLNLLLGLAAIGLLVIALGLSALVPFIGILAFVALGAAALLYLPALIVLSFVIVDDQKPKSVVDLLKTSVERSKTVTTPIWMLAITTLGLSVLIDALFGTNSGLSAENSGGSIIGNIASMIIGIFFSVAAAEIYLKGKKS